MKAPPGPDEEATIVIATGNLSKSFGTRTLWSEIDLTIHPGRMIALVGPDGDGHILLEGGDLPRLCSDGQRRFMDSEPPK